MKPIKKYSELTTDQLVVLRDKVLFRFEEEIEFHISQWKEIIRQLELVANSKGFSLIKE
jgi:AAA+ superfamily predicted ATPase